MADLNDMSLWQFNQVYAGWRHANLPPPPPKPPTAEEFATADWNF